MGEEGEIKRKRKAKSGRQGNHRGGVAVFAGQACTVDETERVSQGAGYFG